MLHILLAASLADTPRNVSFAAEGLDSLEIRHHAGDITVNAVAGIGHVEVAVAVEQWDPACVFETSQDEGKVALRVPQPEFGKVCRMRMAITTSPDMALDLQVTNGDLAISGLRAAARITVGIGDV